MSDLSESPGSDNVGNRIVLAHGFTQTARSWSGFEKLLIQRLPSSKTMAVNLPGHGTASMLRGDLWASAGHLTGQGGRGTYVGYSMGGRVALHAALDHEELIEALVLIGATAGLDSADERQLRRAADEELAKRIESAGVPAFIDEWLKLPLFSGLSANQAQRADRLRNTPEGLASSLRSTGTGTQDSLWRRLPEITIPVLVLAGEDDKKFRTIGNRLANELPNSTFRVIPGAGHSVHLEQPEATADALASWYENMPPG